MAAGADGNSLNFSDCIGCGLCILGCPAYEETGFDALTARGRNKALQHGLPAEEMVDSVLIFVGGILFVIPGVITDIAALVLLIPFSRTIFKRWLRRRFDRAVERGNVRLQYQGKNPDRF